jgi:TPR repeat protein
MKSFGKLPLRRQTKRAALVAALWLTLGNATAGPLEDGVVAYDRGDFKTAIGLWRDAAEAGNAAAQNNLGIMFDLGKGTPRSDKLALFWFLKAARQGYAKAQYNMGRKYDNGEGVEANEVTALMWYTLAASGGSQAFAITRDKLARHLTPAQRRTAHRLAEEWIRAHKE